MKSIRVVLGVLCALAIDRENLGQALKLRPTQRIMAAQSVGLPKGK